MSELVYSVETFHITLRRHAGKFNRHGVPMFSSRGIDAVVEYFKRRGHEDIVAWVPHFRFKAGQGTGNSIDLNEISLYLCSCFARFLEALASKDSPSEAVSHLKLKICIVERIFKIPV